MHTSAGALKVRIIEKALTGEYTALDTAWHYDLVITTFQRLSVEWGKGRQKTNFLFNQARAPQDWGFQRLLAAQELLQHGLSKVFHKQLTAGCGAGALAQGDPGRRAHAGCKPTNDQQAVHGDQPQGGAQVDHDRFAPRRERP